MSEGSERFVLTTTRTVHTQECGNVRHQVEGRVRWVGYRLERDERNLGDGWTATRERHVDEYEPFAVGWVSRDEIEAAQFRYQRCRNCSPDVPDWTSRTRPEATTWAPREFDIAHAVALERERIAAWHEGRSRAFAERAKGRLGDAKFARSVMATHDASARAIRSGAHTPTDSEDTK